MITKPAGDPGDVSEKLLLLKGHRFKSPEGLMFPSESKGKKRKRSPSSQAGGISSLSGKGQLFGLFSLQSTRGGPSMLHRYLFYPRQLNEDIQNTLTGTPRALFNQTSGKSLAQSS